MEKDSDEKILLEENIVKPQYSFFACFRNINFRKDNICIAAYREMVWDSPLQKTWR